MKHKTHRLTPPRRAGNDLTYSPWHCPRADPMDFYFSFVFTFHEDCIQDIEAGEMTIQETMVFPVNHFCLSHHIRDQALHICLWRKMKLWRPTRKMKETIWEPALEPASPLLLLLSHFSRVRLCATLETAAHQAPPSLGFSRQEHWSGLPFPSPMHESEKWKWSRSAVSNPQLPHGLQPSRLLHPWIFQARVLEWCAIAFSVLLRRGP